MILRDLLNNEDVKLIIYVLAESVAARLRKHGLKYKTIAISIRGNDLISFERQGKVEAPTFLPGEITQKAMDLFIGNYRRDNSIRSLVLGGVNW